MGKRGSHQVVPNSKISQSKLSIGIDGQTADV